MTNQYGLILDALRKLKAQSGEGFEGFVRDLLENLCGRTLRLVKSGPQSGRDMNTDPGFLQTGIAIEAKRFGASTSLPLDELKAKLQEAIDNLPGMDVWGVTLSREMKEPDWSELVRVAADNGVTAVCLDWREAQGTLPTLAVLCAAAPHIAQTRLPIGVKSVLGEIATHPDFERIRDNLRDQLNAPHVGFDLARAASSKWLAETLCTSGTAKRRLRSHANLTEPDSHFVERRALTGLLDEWLANKPALPVVLLGDEGRGKTWAALAWLLHRTEVPDAPLVLAVSARDIAAMSPDAVIAETLGRCLPLIEKPILQRRLHRWSRTGQAHFILLVDGLNERLDFDWADFVHAFQEEVWRQAVSLIFTCREVHWRDGLAALEGITDAPIPEIIVPEFTTGERDAFLQICGIEKEDIAPKLLELMRVPRFAHLAITLRDELKDTEDLTIGRLVLEDWRARFKQRGSDLHINDQALLNFVAELGRRAVNDPNFSISRSEIHKHLSEDSGRGLEHYDQAISEIVEGLWLRSEGRPDRFVVNDRLLPLAIGLDLASSIEGLTDRTAIENTIAKYQEQLRGADIATAILRAASSISVARQKATPVAKEALLKTWLSVQNFYNADFHEFWPLISLDPALFVRIAEQHWTNEPVAHGEGEILVKALANAAKWPKVLALLQTILPRWAGGFSLDPHHSRHSNMPENADRQSRVTNNLVAWEHAEAAYEKPIAANLRREASDNLGRAALSIISFLNRAPFVDTIVTWAVARTIEEEPAGETFEWLLRFNRFDYTATEDALLTEIATLKATRQPIAQNAADLLVDAIGGKRTLAQRTSPVPVRPFQHFPNWPRLSEDSSIVWEPDHTEIGLPRETRCLRLATFAANPDARIGNEDLAHTREEADILLTRDQQFDPFSPNEEDMVAVLARWQPQHLSRLVGRFVETLPRFDKYVAHGVNALPLAMLVLDEMQREKLCRSALALLSQPLPEDDKARRQHLFVLQSMAVAGMQDWPAAEQIKILRGFMPALSFSTELCSCLAAPSTADVEQIVNELHVATDEATVGSWLAYLHNVKLPPPPPNAQILIKLASHPSESIREGALKTILSFKDDDLGKAFVASGWSHRQIEKGHAAVLGTYILVLYGGDCAISDITPRIVPQALPYLVETRGCREEELPLVLQFLDNELTTERRSKSAYAHNFQTNAVWAKVLRDNCNEIISKLERGFKEDWPVFGLFQAVPLLEVLRAIMEIAPSEGARLWRIGAHAQKRSTMKWNDFDYIAFSPSAGPELDDLRSEVLRSAETDDALANAVFHALCNKHEAWLIGLIKQLLDDLDVGAIARGLTLAGFLDDTDPARSLWVQKVDKLKFDGWLSTVKSKARCNFKQTSEANHWFDAFLSEEDVALAFAAMRLFERRITVTLRRGPPAVMAGNLA